MKPVLLRQQDCLGLKILLLRHFPQSARCLIDRVKACEIRRVDIIRTQRDPDLRRIAQHHIQHQILIAGERLKFIEENMHPAQIPAAVRSSCRMNRITQRIPHSAGFQF